MFRSILFATLCLALPALLPARAEARPAHHPRWQLLVEHLDWRTASRVVRVERHSYPLLRSEARPIGHTTRLIRKSPHVIDRVRYPVFEQPKPTGYQIMVAVTGYSWGCGTPNGITSSGTVPHVGTVASNILPMGARIYVPSLGYYGVVEDRGAPMDLFAVSCAATYAYTGFRAVTVYS